NGGVVTNLHTWNKASAALMMGGEQLNRWRRDVLGLDAIDETEQLRRMRRVPHLLGFSPTILPRPWDWRRSIHVTGTWFLEPPNTYEPPADLAAFLDAGSPPVAFGFSSSGGKHIAPVTHAIFEALARLGRRGLLIAGFGGLKSSDIPPH